MKPSRYLLLLLLASVPYLASPQVLSTEEMLIADLFFNNATSADVRRIVRPPGISQANASVKVSLSYHKLTLTNVDESNGYVTLSALESQSWMDPRLSWNTSRYQGVDGIRISPSYVWLPDITHYSTSEGTMYTKDDHPELGVKAVIYHSGLVYYIPKRTFSIHCDFDVTDFPSDSQVCELEIGSWVHTKSQLELVVEASSTAPYLLGKAHFEWKITKANLASREVDFDCCTEAYQTIYLTVEMQRIPLFYYYIFIVPSRVVTSILPIIHLFPSGCSQKTTLAGLLLVSSMISHLMLYQQLGGFTSDRPPRLIKQYDTQMILIIVSVAISSITASISNVRHTTRRLPLLVRKFLNSVAAKICCFGSTDMKWRESGRHSERIRFNPVTDTSPIVHDSTDDENNPADSCRSLDALIDELRHVREGRQLEREYYQLALLVDRLTAIVFTIYALVYVFVINPV